MQPLQPLECGICGRIFRTLHDYNDHEAKKLIVNGKVVGEYDIDKALYITRRTPRKHYMIKFHAYPISVKILETLKSQGIESILIIEENRADGKEVYYMASVKDYDNCAVFQEEGYDPQKAFPLERMKILKTTYMNEVIW